MYKGYIIDDFDECFDFDDIEESVTDGIIDLSEEQEHVYSVNEEFNSSLDKFILKRSVNIEDKSEINSPWIYFEINVANALLKENFKMRQFSESKENYGAFPEMAFEADLKNFSKVSIKELLDCLNVPIQEKQNLNKDYFVY